MPACIIVIEKRVLSKTIHFLTYSIRASNDYDSCAVLAVDASPFIVIAVAVVVFWYMFSAEDSALCLAVLDAFSVCDARLAEVCVAAIKVALGHGIDMVDATTVPARYLVIGSSIVINIKKNSKEIVGSIVFALRSVRDAAGSHQSALGRMSRALGKCSLRRSPSCGECAARMPRLGDAPVLPAGRARPITECA